MASLPGTTPGNANMTHTITGKITNPDCSTGERHHAEALREEVTAVLAPMGLRLAPEKTRVVHIDEGFDFLGFTIRRLRKRGTQKHYACTRPSRKATQAIKDKVTAR